MGAKLLQDVRQDLADVVQVCEGKKKQTNYLRTLINELVKGTGPPGRALGPGPPRPPPGAPSRAHWGQVAAALRRRQVPPGLAHVAICTDLPVRAAGGQASKGPRVCFSYLLGPERSLRSLPSLGGWPPQRKSGGREGYRERAPRCLKSLACR